MPRFDRPEHKIRDSTSTAPEIRTPFWNEAHAHAKNRSRSSARGHSFSDTHIPPAIYDLRDTPIRLILLRFKCFVFRVANRVDFLPQRLALIPLLLGVPSATKHIPLILLRFKCLLCLRDRRASSVRSACARGKGRRELRAWSIVGNPAPDRWDFCQAGVRFRADGGDFGSENDTGGAWSVFLGIVNRLALFLRIVRLIATA